jgi:hypothetical protein
MVWPGHGQTCPWADPATIWLGRGLDWRFSGKIAWLAMGSTGHVLGWPWVELTMG